MLFGGAFLRQVAFVWLEMLAGAFLGLSWCYVVLWEDGVAAAANRLAID